MDVRLFWPIWIDLDFIILFNFIIIYIKYLKEHKCMLYIYVLNSRYHSSSLVAPFS